MDALFEGLKGIPWASMTHAYGSAEDVPRMLRGLVSSSPEEREVALDGMYGAVHHQGDIYECTAAAIPFLLEALARTELPGRGDILGLLASIGRAPDTEDSSEQTENDVRLDNLSQPDPEDPEFQAQQALERRAKLAIQQGLPLYLAALADPDAEVRRAAPRALLACAEEARCTRALLDRFAVEPDGEARLRQLGAVARLGQHSGDPGPRLWLASVAHGDAAPALRLAALAELLRGTRGAIPPETIAAIGDLLDRVYTEVPPPAPKKSWTDTLIGALRRLAAEEASGRRAPDASKAVHAICRAMGDRVETRLALLAGLLRSPRWEQRKDAVGAVAVFAEKWRGDHAEVAALLGQQLTGENPRLYEPTARTLRGMFALAAPAADAMHHSLQSAPREAPPTSQGHPPWITLWPSDPPTCGPTLAALAQLQDHRALPALAWALERRELPSDIGFVVAPLGPKASPLAPLLCKRLGELSPGSPEARPIHGLLAALRAVGSGAAAALPQLADLAPLHKAAIEIIGRLGAAGEVAPLLRRLQDEDEHGIALEAAAALWQAEQREAALIAVLERFLRSGDEYARRGALDKLSLLGKKSSIFEARIRELLAEEDPHCWGATHAAMALWRATGDLQTSSEALRSAWQRNTSTRGVIASFLAREGALAATLRPELEEESKAARRHNAHSFISNSHGIQQDENLLRACRQALAGEPPPRSP